MIRLKLNISRTLKCYLCLTKDSSDFVHSMNKLVYVVIWRTRPNESKKVFTRTMPVYRRR